MNPNTKNEIIKQFRERFHFKLIFSNDIESTEEELEKWLASKLQEVERAGRIKEQEWIEESLDRSAFFDEYENGKKIYDLIYELLTRRYNELKKTDPLAQLKGEQHE